jgi:diphthamide synthase (EF-2-diphthine--ammonia ligase)
MARIGMQCLFPLWGKPTTALAGEFLDLGFRAIVACLDTLDTEALSGEFAGREYDKDFIKDLPPGVDPCGEIGGWICYPSFAIFPDF